MENELFEKVDKAGGTILVAKRFFASHPKFKSVQKVDCKERIFDNLWEMLVNVEDPTLTIEQLNDLNARKLPIPTRWLTAEIVKPYVIEGILKSIERVKD